MLYVLTYKCVLDLQICYMFLTFKGVLDIQMGSMVIFMHSQMCFGHTNKFLTYE